MVDITSLVIKLIGGQKLLEVASVFAEGTNITKQVPGFSILGNNSILNSIPQLQSALSGGGLAGVFTNNPVASLANSLTSVCNTNLPIVSAMTSTTANAGNTANTGTTTAQAFPLFTQALKTATANLAAYYYMSQLLTGQQVPDYNNNEYGLVDILSVSEDGSAALNDLIAPLLIGSTLTLALTSLTLLLTSVTNRGVSDAQAVSQLSTIMLPINSSVATSQTAYNNATTQQSSNSIIGQALSYVNGIPSEQSDFVQGLLSPPLIPPIIAANQEQLAMVDENTAQAELQRLENERIHNLIMEIANGRETNTVSGNKS